MIFDFIYILFINLNKIPGVGIDMRIKENVNERGNRIFSFLPEMW